MPTIVFVCLLGLIYFGGMILVLIVIVKTIRRRKLLHEQ